jgi:hypothetical protein
MYAYRVSINKSIRNDENRLIDSSFVEYVPNLEMVARIINRFRDINQDVEPIHSINIETIWIQEVIKKE